MKIKNLRLVINIIKENKSFIAYSPALDLSSFGKTEKEAKSRFEEIAKIFFNDLTERGTLNDVLTELGWNKKIISKKSLWIPPRVDSKSINIGIPMPA